MVHLVEPLKSMGAFWEGFSYLLYIYEVRDERVCYLGYCEVWRGSIGRPLVSAIRGIPTPVAWASESEGFRRVAWASLEVYLPSF